MRLRLPRLLLVLALGYLLGYLLAPMGVDSGMPPLLVFALMVLLGVALGHLLAPWVWGER